jgi:hypothetical protein
MEASLQGHAELLCCVACKKDMTFTSLPYSVGISPWTMHSSNSSSSQPVACTAPGSIGHTCRPLETLSDAGGGGGGGERGQAGIAHHKRSHDAGEKDAAAAAAAVAGGGGGRHGKHGGIRHADRTEEEARFRGRDKRRSGGAASGGGGGGGSGGEGGGEGAGGDVGGAAECPYCHAQLWCSVECWAEDEEKHAKSHVCHLMRQACEAGSPCLNLGQVGEVYTCVMHVHDHGLL